jgi:ATP-binding cassette subfamily D (ALD) long-chain fatty acid import protein
MGIARMLYHQPRFAVLDECTSAVSDDAEEELYRAAMTSGTTCVTVSQRLTLPEFHQFELKVGVNEARGWSAAAIEAGQANQLLSGSQGEAMHATTELH